jgi:DNA-binding MarR family transcriptional regulator
MHQPEPPLWIVLHKISKRYKDALAARLGHLGIHRHFFVILAIGFGGGTVTQQNLADTLDVDKVSMVTILDYIEKAGFIERQSHPGDRRKRMLSLTAKGRKAVPQIEREIRELNRLAESALPREFRHLFTKIWDQLLVTYEVAQTQNRPIAGGFPETTPKRAPRAAKKRVLVG